ncbi:hypothetical protein QJS04_geneDACA018173 [Acorus gramineus]|uniref:Uncharacterized protein n=1 Tax=Acorus gramineus TaxID=55184 RepID=A0AAV9AKB6_ACOGR|nr:hypothetical protein QJS04_geneDACA018173 [Acorus gramineus]
MEGSLTTAFPLPNRQEQEKTHRLPATSPTIPINSVPTDAVPTGTTRVVSVPVVPTSNLRRPGADLHRQISIP